MRWRILVRQRPVTKRSVQYHASISSTISEKDHTAFLIMPDGGCGAGVVLWCVRAVLRRGQTPLDIAVGLSTTYEFMSQKE